MMQTNKPLAFYETLAEQFERNSEFNSKFDLVSPNTLLPFQIISPIDVALYAVIDVYNTETDIKDNTESAKTATMFLEVGDSTNGVFEGGYRILKYRGGATTTLSDGKWYLKVRLYQSGGVGSEVYKSYYSEKFEINSSCIPLVIGYYETGSNPFLIGDTDIISYSSSYKSMVQLRTKLSMPEYPIEIEMKKRDGVVFPIKSLTYKKYKFDFVCPEFLVDAIRLIPQHDNIELYYNGKTYICDNMTITPKPSEAHEFYVVEVEFTTGVVVKKNARIL
jgi:hypothetical protein